MKLSPFAAVLVLLGAAHAATYAEVCGISQFDSGTGATSFITIAFMLVSLAIALAFMYSKIKQNEEVGIWAKDEALNLLISVFLFAGLIAFFQGSCAIAGEYSGNAKDPFATANFYLSRLIEANGNSILRALTYTSLENQFSATEYMYIGITPFSGSGMATYANLKGLSAHKEFLIDLYLPIMASLNAQRQILQMMQWIGASVLLPFAFIMRLVPPTREFGNIMIAVFFAIYVVVPTAYAMSGSAFAQIASAPSCVNCGVHNFYSYGIDGPPANGAAWNNAILYKIGSAIPQAVFIPNLVLIIAITCVMSLSKALRAMAV